jgi:putative FmdB family regulatory protein
MPIYEYRCDRCDERWELRRSVADRDAHSACPRCRRRAERVLFPGANVGRSPSSTRPAENTSGLPADHRPRVHISNSTFKNGDVGIQTNGPGRISLKNVKFENVKRPIVRGRGD